MFALLGICVSLAALFALTFCGSAAAAGFWRASAPFTRGWSARSRSRALFALSVMPIAVAASAVTGYVVPAYLVHEPRDTDEEVGVLIFAAACLSCTGLLLCAKRVAATWLATRGLRRKWMRGAVPVALPGVSFPAYRIRHEFPVVAVLGAFRPKLFIAEQLFRELSPEELRAACAHERGHLAAGDNLKHATMRVLQEAVPLFNVGASLTGAWRVEAEAAADEFAAAEGPRSALDLASAILKIARLAPEGATPTRVAAAAAHLLGEEGGVAERVRRLLQLAGDYDRLAAPAPARAQLARRLLQLACLCSTALFAATHSEALKVTHAAIEHVVLNTR